MPVTPTQVVTLVESPIGKTETPSRKEFQLALINKTVSSTLQLSYICPNSMPTIKHKSIAYVPIMI